MRYALTSPSFLKVQILFLTILLGSARIYAQTQVWTDAGLEQRQGKDPYVLNVRSDDPDTLVLTANNPFLDDFSYESSIPDSNKWFVRDIDFRIPRVVRNGAVSPPSVGTLRFDGLRRTGIPYETFQPTRGLADRLVSHYLDLSAFDSADNIRLYLYLESGGRSEAPESSDSIRIYLNTVSDTILIAAVGGDLPGGSTWISVPIVREAYFTSLSQIVIEAEGSQNGLLDVWHVDYVYLGPEWPGGIANLNDRSLIRLESSPIEPYFSLPEKLYRRNASWQSAYEISVRQNALTSYSGSLYTEWSSPTSSPVSPFFSNLNFLIPSTGTQAVLAPAQAVQSPEAIGPWISLNYLTSNADRIPANDTLRTRIPVDSLIGYDDGEPDQVFGLNKPLGFGVRFDLPAPDTITAVWMHFSPLLFVNGVNGKVTYLDGTPFRFRVWNQPHPDSFIVEQVVNMNVTYGVEGEYVRLELTEPKAVPATFWAGLQQLNEIPIGLGLDKSYDRDAWTFRDSLGNWVNTRIDGAPMIRIELATDGKSPIASNEPAIHQVLPVFPGLLGNLVHQGESLIITNCLGMAEYHGTLLDMQGRSLFQLSELRPSGEITTRIPWEISEGLYIWRHEWKINGQTFIHSERLSLRP